MNGIENVIFEVAEALRVPVLILALLALAISLIELGAFLVELVRRRRRDYARLETASLEARAALDRGDEAGAKSALRPVAWSTAMARALAFMVDQGAKGQSGDRLAKGLADFDFRSLRRLERTRLLVRAGPALGLMGTLIPLSPALEGLADGNTEELSDNLRVAFSVTVLGLLIGAIAFAISLVRDRLYGQDLSDLEFVAATLAPDSDFGGGAAAAPPRPAGRTGGAPAPPPPPVGAAAVGDKPPPPKDAKPLGAALPPPSGAPAAPAAPPAPTPSASGDATASSAPAPTASAASGGAAAPAPMPTGGQSAAAEPPGHAAHSPLEASTAGSTETTAPADAAPPPPPTGAAAPDAPPPPPAPEGANEPPRPAPLPPPPIPEPPTQALPPTGAQDQPPGDGRPAPAPENQ